MAELVFYGGVNEIGGNRIFLSDKETGIFLGWSWSKLREGKQLLSLSIPCTKRGKASSFTEYPAGNTWNLQE